jgi:uncharacterized protein (DUF2147 family)
MIDRTTKLFAALAALSLAAAPSSAAAAQSPEGRWANPKRSVIVKVTRCGNAYCGTVSWANAKNRDKGATPGKTVLSDLRPAGQGVYKGRALEPKRNISGSATVRQVGPNVILVKGCAIAGLLCKEQRWTRVTS